jgi:hypothetical protein
VSHEASEGGSLKVRPAELVCVKSFEARSVEDIGAGQAIGICRALMQGTFRRYGTLIVSRQRSDESRVGGATDGGSSGFCNEVAPRGGATMVSSMGSRF